VLCLQINRVLGLALNTKALRDRLMDTTAYVNEANLEHARAMCKVERGHSRVVSHGS
jgi:dynein heavy chain